ncbi:MAG: ComEA family DNA-binding protein [Ectothiorhodospira sp.]
MAQASRAVARLPDETLPEILFEIDELTLAQGGRTARQARWMEVLGDFAGLRMQVAEPAAEDGSASRGSVPGRIDLNRASIEALQEIPHIGPERAEAITRIRPIRQMTELEAIDGIGPQRRAEIAEHATLE